MFTEIMSIIKIFANIANNTFIRTIYLCNNKYMLINTCLTHTSLLLKMVFVIMKNDRHINVPLSL